MPALIVRPCQPGDAPVTKPRLEVVVHGYANTSELRLVIWQKKESPFLTKLVASRKVAVLSVKLEEAAAPDRIAKVYKITSASVLKNECWDGGPVCNGPEMELVFPPSAAPISIKLPHLWPGDSTDPNVQAKRPNIDEGDGWHLRVTLNNAPDAGKILLDSPSIFIGKVNRALPARKNWDESRATYSWHAGNDATLYNDGSTDQNGTSGAFQDIKNAIDGAQRFIFVVDWTFHPYARLTQNPLSSLGETIGSHLVIKAKAMQNAKQDFLVAVHTWDHTSPTREVPNEAGDSGLDAIANQLGMGAKRPDNVLWRASNRTGEGGTFGFGFSHHQKFVVVDCDARDGSGRRELKGFFGGLDLTKGRFDWPVHPIEPDILQCPESMNFRDPLEGREMDLSVILRLPSKYKSKKEYYNDWYNAEFGHDFSLPRQPWHDIHAQITGPAVWDMVREFVGRWALDPVGPDWRCRGNGITTAPRLYDLFSKLTDRTKFVQQWERTIGGWSAQVLRSQCKIHWSPDTSLKATGAGATLKGQHQKKEELVWPLKKIERGFARFDYEMESSILDAYIRVIKQARRFIYIETQYLLGSGGKWGRDAVANKVPETIVDRIVQRASVNKDFHAYIVLPMYPEGDPASLALRSVKEYQWNTIRWMISNLNGRLPGAGQDRWKRYLSFYFLAQWHNLANGVNTSENDRKRRVANNRRYMIYVHSKLMIIDDRYLMLGSANLNERSLHGGRDSEICLHLWPTSNQHLPAVKDEIRGLRKRLWREHLGRDLSDALFQAPEKQPCIDLVRSEADQNLIDLYAGKRTGDTMADWPHLCRWPIVLRPDNTIGFTGADGNDYHSIVDAPTTKTKIKRDVIIDEDWFWDTKTLMPSDIPE